MNILVFASAYVRNKVYEKAAKELGRLIAENNHTLIFGGSDKGLMKCLADGAQEAGGKVVGITTKVYKKSLREGLDESIITETLQERKKLMLARSEAVVLLPGGIGAFDEFFEIMELKKQKAHDKPMFVLNTNEFFNGLREQMLSMEKQGFLPKALEEFVVFCDSPNEVIEKI